MKRVRWTAPAGTVAAILAAVLLAGAGYGEPGPGPGVIVHATAEPHLATHVTTIWSPPTFSTPASMVNTFAGTGKVTATTGDHVAEFPGADVPFGMMQWSPDTWPHRITSGGYAWDNRETSGFSLTHLSGAGCNTEGDVPILPTVGPIGGDPAAAMASFGHADERAGPGRFQMKLGNPAVTMELAVTTHTGIATMVFPKTRRANLIFKVTGSAKGTSAETARVDGHDEIDGQVTSGKFCGRGPEYTIHFVATFDQRFVNQGTWSSSRVNAGSRECAGVGCGAYVTFDTTRDPVVVMKIAISYVSLAGALANLRSEDPNWTMASVEQSGVDAWNHLLDRVNIGGGSMTSERTFYTALYHSLLFPSIVSDADGRYMGEDGHVHATTQRRAEFSNFSEWDIYRGEIQLLSLVAPRQTGAMVQSLVNDAAQRGWLPRWAVVDGDGAVMNGDSADAIIADAYAFGIRNFDTRAALAAMVKGATVAMPVSGPTQEREYLSQYVTQRYVDSTALTVAAYPATHGASTTIEYAIDDFAISEFAHALDDTSVARSMMRRAQNWEYLFNPATASLEGRMKGGAFPSGPAFNPAQFNHDGQAGFQEGNPLQYTWSVPQDLTALGAMMGGSGAAERKLNALFATTNAGRYKPFDWAGNEPSLWSPWEYDWFGAPAQTEKAVRSIMTRWYGDGPVDEPGNDDLGAMSAWYVWSSLGMYPVTPGTSTLALSTPLFPTATIALPDGHHLVLRAVGAAPDVPYIEHLAVTTASSTAPLTAPSTTCPGSVLATKASTVTAPGWNDPWIPGSFLTRGADLTFTVGRTPNPAWGTAPSERPPSYESHLLPALGATTPGGVARVGSDHVAPLTLSMRAAVDRSMSVSWTATASTGIGLSETSGTFNLRSVRARASQQGCPLPTPRKHTLSMTDISNARGSVTFSFLASTGATLPPVVVDILPQS